MFQPVTATPDVSIVAPATRGYIVQPVADTLAVPLATEPMDEQPDTSIPSAGSDSSLAIRIRIFEQKAVVSKLRADAEKHEAAAKKYEAEAIEAETQAYELRLQQAGRIE